MFKVKFATKRIISPLVRGIVVENEGCLINGLALYRKEVLAAAVQYAGVEKFDESTVAEVERLMNEPEATMSFGIGELLRERFPNGLIAKLSPERFTKQFVHTRASGWGLRAIDCSLYYKEGARDLIDQLKNGDRFVGMYTNMPRLVAVQSIGPLLDADRLFSGDKLLASDDKLLTDVFNKQSERGWECLAAVARKRSQIVPAEMVAIDYAAAAAVGALKAGYSAVIIVPDPEAGSVETWDKDNAIAEHLLAFPEHAEKLIFLKSLRDLKFI